MVGLGPASVVSQLRTDLDDSVRCLGVLGFDKHLNTNRGFMYLFEWIMRNRSPTTFLKSMGFSNKKEYKYSFSNLEILRQ